METEINLRLSHQTKRRPQHLLLKLSRAQFSKYGFGGNRKIHRFVKANIKRRRIVGKDIEEVVCWRQTRRPKMQEEVKNLLAKNQQKVNPDELVAMGLLCKAD
jgi:molecular chaperone DnaK (HSP70)